MWCRCIGIRGCSRAPNHLLKAAGCKLHATKKRKARPVRAFPRHYCNSFTLSRMFSRHQFATYHGHRRRSYFPANTGELVEYRARQRTFDNAYLRTSLVNLSYSAVILKLFDSRFYNSKPSTPLGEMNILGLTFSLASWTPLCYPCSTITGYCLYTASLFQSGFLRSSPSYSGALTPLIWLCSCLGSTIHDSGVDRCSGHNNCGFCPNYPSRTTSSALSRHTDLTPFPLPAISRPRQNYDSGK